MNNPVSRSLLVIDPRTASQGSRSLKGMQGTTEGLIHVRQRLRLPYKTSGRVSVRHLATRRFLGRAAPLVASFVRHELAGAHVGAAQALREAACPSVLRIGHDSTWHRTLNIAMAKHGKQGSRNIAKRGRHVLMWCFVVLRGLLRLRVLRQRPARSRSEDCAYTHAWKRCHGIFI